MFYHLRTLDSISIYYWGADIGAKRDAQFDGVRQGSTFSLETGRINRVDDDDDDALLYAYAI